jgi:hypothetical protein
MWPATRSVQMEAKAVLMRGELNKIHTSCKKKVLPKEKRQNV